MLFGLFGKKDHRHYLTQGGKALAAERFADARLDFEEALKLCPADAAGEQQEARNGLTAAGDGLGRLNLHEGELCVTAGELAKAADHFTLAAELAFDETIKAMARERLRKMEQGAPAPAAPAAAAHAAAPTAPAARAAAAGPYAAYAQQGGSATTAPQPAQPAAPQGHGHGHHHGHGGGSCGSCSDTGCHTAPGEEPDTSHLSDEDQFQLLIHPLPGELTGRYAALGEKFKQAYLLIHDGNDAKAFPILQELLVSGENDIVIYELALIMYRSGRAHECENLLKRSLQLCETNALSYIALIHLLAERQRFAEALAVVGRMLELDLMTDQATYMQGELYQAMGDEAKAMDSWSKALEMPGVAKSAAQKLCEILDAQGRHDEVKFLAKKYLKGCH